MSQTPRDTHTHSQLRGRSWTEPVRSPMVPGAPARLEEGSIRDVEGLELTGR